MSASQREAAKRILEALVASVNELDTVHADEKRHTDDKRPTDKGPAADHHRRNRILFVDGVRGAGKTSVVTSIMDAFHQLRAGKKKESRWLNDIAPDAAHDESVLRRVLWLDWLDMDPLPGDTNFLAAIAVRLGTWLQTGSNCPQPTESLGQSARQIYERFAFRAAFAWDGGPPGRSGSNDPERIATETIRLEEMRLDLGRHLSRLLHQIGDEMEGREGRPLFVLPIDDCDLNPARSIEILKLVRTFTVPELFTIVLGAHDLTREIMTHSTQGSLSRLSGGKDPLLSTRVREIGANQVRKVVPPAQVLKVELPTLAEALDKTRPLGSEASPSLRNLLARVPVSVPGEIVGGVETRRWVYLDRMLGAMLDPTEADGHRSVRNLYVGARALRLPYRHLIDLWTELYRLCDTADRGEAEAKRGLLSTTEGKKEADAKLPPERLESIRSRADQRRAVLRRIIHVVYKIRSELQEAARRSAVSPQSTGSRDVLAEHLQESINSLSLREHGVNFATDDAARELEDLKNGFRSVVRLFGEGKEFSNDLKRAIHREAAVLRRFRKELHDLQDVKTNAWKPHLMSMLARLFHDAIREDHAIDTAQLERARDAVLESSATGEILLDPSAFELTVRLGPTLEIHSEIQNPGVPLEVHAHRLLRTDLRVAGSTAPLSDATVGAFSLLHDLTLMYGGATLGKPIRDASIDQRARARWNGEHDVPWFADTWSTLWELDRCSVLWNRAVQTATRIESWESWMGPRGGTRLLAYGWIVASLFVLEDPEADTIAHPPPQAQSSDPTSDLVAIHQEDRSRGDRLPLTTKEQQCLLRMLTPEFGSQQEEDTEAWDEGWTTLERRLRRWTEELGERWRENIYSSTTALIERFLVNSWSILTPECGVFRPGALSSSTSTSAAFNAMFDVFKNIGEDPTVRRLATKIQRHRLDHLKRLKLRSEHVLASVMGATWWDPYTPRREGEPSGAAEPLTDAFLSAVKHHPVNRTGLAVSRDLVEQQYQLLSAEDKDRVPASVRDILYPPAKPPGSESRGGPAPEGSPPPPSGPARPDTAKSRKSGKAST
ncbi:MAG: hypothetical protein R3F14_22980 [Polyangiaceae bacterium]